jgi:2-polyprenyl-3-methyl-5-hydroxy-6-metoxy-1,4-benzoquinol methylase
MKKIVYKIEDGMDRKEIEATTYQMRNFYRQMGDGFFSVLDVMNYIQHQQIVRLCKKGNHVLDICCGRGLLLPMLRYERKDIASYTGVDIEPKNAIFTSQRVTDNKPIEKDYYPFPVNFIESNVSEMSQKTSKKFDVIVYTSAIEHMQKETGMQSLFECRKLAHPGTLFILTCPNTPENQDGYDCQYAAHVYEWKRSELLEGLQLAKFKVVTEWGLLMDKQVLYEEAQKLGLYQSIKRIEKFIPSEWFVPIFSPLFPEKSKEIAFLAVAI